MRGLARALVLVAVTGCAGGGDKATSPGKIQVPVQPSAPAHGPSASAPSSPAVAGAPKAVRPKIVKLSHSQAECGIDAAGVPWRWGTAEFERIDPAGTLSGVTDVACGGRHFCAIGGDGGALCWGNNECGDLGLGDASMKDQFRHDPSKVVALPPVTEIGNTHCRTCARTTTGDVYCWGDTSWGKAGDGTLLDEGTSAWRPRVGAPIIKDATMLAVADSHACVVVKDGRVACWGAGVPSGQAKQSVARPTFVTKVKDAAFVATAENVTCVIDRSGSVTCWGQNPYGVLGPNAKEADYVSTPTLVTVPLGERAVAIAVGDGGGHACARLESGALSCWGKNEYGQLGDGTTKNRKTPMRVSLPGKVIDVSAGLDVSCALVEDGRVFCFGNNVKKSAGMGLDSSATPVEMGLR